MQLIPTKTWQLKYFIQQQAIIKILIVHLSDENWVILDTRMLCDGMKKKLTLKLHFILYVTLYSSTLCIIRLCLFLETLNWLLGKGLWLKMVNYINPPAVFNAFSKFPYKSVVKYKDFVFILRLCSKIIKVKWKTLTHLKI